MGLAVIGMRRTRPDRRREARRALWALLRWSFWIAAAVICAPQPPVVEGAPRLASVSPSLVVAGASDPLEVRGLNLSDVDRVTMGELSVPFTQPAPETLWVQVPADMPAGSYLLRVHSPQGSSNGVLVQVLVTRIAGRITYAGGAVSGHPLYLVRRSSIPATDGLEPVASVQTSADGAFAFERVSPGAYWLVVPKGAAEGPLHRYAVEVELSAQRPVHDAGTIDLWAELEVSLHLAGETRVGAGPLRVNGAAWRGEGPLSVVWTAGTDLSDGAATLHLARLGEPGRGEIGWVLTREAVGGAAFVEQSARREMEAGAYQLFIELTSGARRVWLAGPILHVIPGSVRGRVLAGGRPVAGEPVYLERGGRPVEAVRLDHEGRFLLGGSGDGLPPGEYRLRLQRGDPAAYEIARPVTIGVFTPEIELAPWEIEREPAALASLSFRVTSGEDEVRRVAPGERLTLNGAGLTARPVVLAVELPAADAGILEVWGREGSPSARGRGGRLVIGREWLPQEGVYRTFLRLPDASAPGAERLVAGPTLDVRPGVLSFTVDHSLLRQGALRLFGPEGEVLLTQEGDALVARGVGPGQYRAVYTAYAAGPGELESLELSLTIGLFEPLSVSHSLHLIPRAAPFTLRLGDRPVQDGEVVNRFALTEATPLTLAWEPVAGARSQRIVASLDGEQGPAGGSGGRGIAEALGGAGTELVWSGLPAGTHRFSLEVALENGTARYKGLQFTVTEGSVRGRAVAADRPLAGVVVLRPVDVNEAGTTGAKIVARDGAGQEGLESRPLAADGTFLFEALPPGDYLLEARVDGEDAASGAWVNRIAVPVRIAAVGSALAEGEAVAVDLGTLSFDVASEFLYTLRDFEAGAVKTLSPGEPAEAGPGSGLGVRVRWADGAASKTEEASVVLELFGVPMAQWHARGERLEEVAGEHRLAHYGVWRAVLTRRLASGAWVEVAGPAVRLVAPGGAAGWSFVYVAPTPSFFVESPFVLPRTSPLLPVGEPFAGARSPAVNGERVHLAVDERASATVTLPAPYFSGAELTVELSMALFNSVGSGKERPFSVVIDDGVRQASFLLPSGPHRAPGGYQAYRFVVAGDEAYVTGPGWREPGRIVQASAGAPAITFGFLGETQEEVAAAEGERKERSKVEESAAPPVAEAHIHYVAVTGSGAFPEAGLLPSPAFAPVPFDRDLGFTAFAVQRGERGSLLLSWESAGEVERAWVYVRDRASGRLVVAFPRERGEPPVVQLANLPAGEYDVGVSLVGKRGAVTSREEPVAVAPYWSEIATGRRAFAAWRSGGWAVYTMGEELTLSAARGHSAWIMTSIAPGAAEAGITVEVVARGPGSEGLFEIVVNDGRGAVNAAWARDAVVVAGDSKTLPPLEEEQVRYRMTVQAEGEDQVTVQLYRNGVPLFASPRSVRREVNGAAEEASSYLLLRQRHPADAQTDSSFTTVEGVYVSTGGAFSPQELSVPRQEELEDLPATAREEQRPALQ